MMIVAMAVIGVAAGCRGKQPKQGAGTPTLKNITAQEAHEMIQQRKEDAAFVILDVRTPQEFAQGHLVDAVNLDFHAPTFRGELDKFEKTKTYLVYCRSGNRSGKALDVMRELGFAEAYNVIGGMNVWTREGLPVSR